MSMGIRVHCCQCPICAIPQDRDTVDWDLIPTVAIDRAEAVKKAADLWPNVIVMDLAMPHMNGWEAIRLLHQSSWTSMIPVIAVSAIADGRDAAFAVGCDAYLTKPCTPQVLWAQIQALLTPPDARPPYK